VAVKPPSPNPSIFEELAQPLADLGQRWAASPYRPRPSLETLEKWDRLLDAWMASALPILLRDSRNRGARIDCTSGRSVVFGDNSPANWVFALALAGEVPDVASWSGETIDEHVPLTFVTKGPAGKRDLNKFGWKVCHIEPVSDRGRYDVATAPTERLEAEFRRFLSPRNIFLIPKSISGAGELPEVVAAVAEFERANA
jgi:hypothetical protein